MSDDGNDDNKKRRRKKTHAQIQRMIQRAQARGTVYQPPVWYNPVHQQRSRAVTTLQTALAQNNNDTTLKAKERRSAKRKAEAIAVETSGMDSVEALMEWAQQQQRPSGKQPLKRATQPQPHHDESKQQPLQSQQDKASNNSNNKPIPYILFVGQLSYDTTAEQLQKHFLQHLHEEHFKDVSASQIKVRLLTDAKSKRSKGMAFVELVGPSQKQQQQHNTSTAPKQQHHPQPAELLHCCLKLHHTQLGNRRINVEKTTGGGKEKRTAQLEHLRHSQHEYVQQTVQAILDEYHQRGEVQQGELDDGVLALCARHSTKVVAAALEHYVEQRGGDTDNPSAYLTFLLTKFSTQGVYTKAEQRQKPNSHHPSRSRSNVRRSSPQSSNQNNNNNTASHFANQGVDMSLSHPSNNNSLSKIFPSMNRGRGYMRRR